MTTDRLIEAFASGFTYAEYRAMISDLLAQGKTTGPDQSEGMIEYAQLNNKRMDRGDKTVKVDEETRTLLNDIRPNEKWLVITEGWCGDASQIVPVLSKLEEAVDGLEVKMILRDDNPDVMDAFLTDGTRSIPKLVRLNAETFEVLGEWGPRPQEMQDIVEEWKKTKAIPKEEMYLELHGQYAKNRGKAVVRELVEELQKTYKQLA